MLNLDLYGNRCYSAILAICEGDVFISDPKTEANVFKDYFASQATIPNNDSAPVGIHAVHMTVTEGEGESDVFFGLKICTLGIFWGQRSIMYILGLEKMCVFFGQSSSEFFCDH